MKAVIVSGSRDWDDRRAVWDSLDSARPDIVVHGACASGADRYASRWCAAWDVTELPMPAQWDRYGKAAGPKRNAHMVELGVSLQQCGWAVDVLAFPPKEDRPSGTRNLIRLAKAADLKVVQP